MSGRFRWLFWAAAVVMMMLGAAVGARDLSPVTQPAPLVAGTQPAVTTAAATGPAVLKNVVMLDGLVAMYEPVPFAHRMHAEMAQTSKGCTTCHHHTPTPTTMAATQASAAVRRNAPSQDDAAAIPACRSCHPITADKPDIHMPSLKGAYHRQCLNCHRAWMADNACVICHAPQRGGKVATAATMPAPTPDDIVGRMHKPIPEPEDQLYVARFTPVAGANVLFRHKEHVKDFGIKCESCHQRDTCGDCHAAAAALADTAPASSKGSVAATPTTLATQTPATAAAAPVPAAATGPRPVHPGRTWRETHDPCVSCHQDDRCTVCHYDSRQQPPPRFAHPMTGQTLDADHVKLACAQCHARLKSVSPPTCGDASCHKKAVRFPQDRPGPFIAAATMAATQPAATQSAATQTAASQPSTRPVLIRIRRGGS